MTKTQLKSVKELTERQDAYLILKEWLENVREEKGGDITTIEIFSRYIGHLYRNQLERKETTILDIIEEYLNEKISEFDKLIEKI